MDRDAFASLFSRQANSKNKTGGARSSSSSSSRGGKSPRGRRASPSAPKRSDSKRPRSADEGSSFVECPLCGRSIHCSLVQVHVERCAGRDESTGQNLSTPSQAAGNAAPSSFRQHEQSPSPSPSPPAVVVCGMSPDPRRSSSRGARGVALAAAAATAPDGTDATAGSSEDVGPFAVQVSPSKLSGGTPAAVLVVAAAGAAELGRESPSMIKPHLAAGALTAVTAEGEAEEAAAKAAEAAAAEPEAAEAAEAEAATPAVPATPAPPTADEEPISCIRVSSANAADAAPQRRLERKRNNPRGDQYSGAAPATVKPQRPAGDNNNNNNNNNNNTIKPTKTTKTTKTTKAAANKVASPTPTPKNAFSTLMAASALTNFREEMYLWGHEDGTLSWGWGAAGAPLPAPPTPPPSLTDADTTAHSRGGVKSGACAVNPRRWSCQVATKGPEGRKAGMCEVWTNLPSVGSACAPSPPPGVRLAGRVGDAAERPCGSGSGSWGGRGGGGGGGGGAVASTGRDENVGLKAVHPGRSLSRLSVAVVKSMLQKNVRRGKAEAAARCALDLALKSWSDAIRRVLVIIVEDSLLHPAAPFLTWLMVATSKGYRPPPVLLDAFLRVVYETAACPVRDTTDSCFLFLRPQRFRGSGSGSGSGIGNGDSGGNGNGYSNGNGGGNGNNNGSRNGSGSGNCNGSGNGSGDGSGNDSGNGGGNGDGGGGTYGGGCSGDHSLPASFEADEFAAPHPKDLMFRPGQRNARRARTSSCGGAEVSAEHRPLSSATLPGREKGGGGRELEGGSGAGGGTELVSRRDPSRKESRDGGEEGLEFSSESYGGASAAETAAADAATAAATDAPPDSSASTDGAAATEGAATDEEDAAIACFRRSLLMRASYGGMPFDQALLKGSCLAWGERSGHCTPSPARASDRAVFSDCCSGSGGGGGGGGSEGGGRRAGIGNGADKSKLRSSPPPPPPPPPPTRKATDAAFGGASPFGYVRGKVVSSWKAGGWTQFLAAAHAGAGMPEALRWRLMAHVAGGCGGGVGAANGATRATGSERLGEGGAGGRRVRAGRRELGSDEAVAVAVADAVEAEMEVEVAAAGGLAATATAVVDPVAPAAAERQRGPILREEDAILSGVDFHCSSVLDDLLRSTALAARVGTALHATTASATAAAAHGGDPGVGAKQAAKQAMWACSSGLNVRRLQVAFSPGGGGVDRERMSGPNGGCESGPRAYLKRTQTEAITEGGLAGGALCGGEGVSETDARVWAALSPDVLDWTRRFVRARLAPGAMKPNR